MKPEKSLEEQNIDSYCDQLGWSKVERDLVIKALRSACLNVQEILQDVAAAFSKIDLKGLRYSLDKINSSSIEEPIIPYREQQAARWANKYSHKRKRTL